MTIKDIDLHNALFLSDRLRSMRGATKLLGKIAAGEDWQFPDDALKFIEDKRVLAELVLELISVEMLQTEQELLRLGLVFECKEKADA